MPNPSGCFPIIVMSAAAGPVIEYANDGSSPLTEKTQMSIVAVPDASRVITSHPAPSVHVSAATEKMPAAATAMVTSCCAASEPAVEGSTTIMSLPVAEGLVGVSGIISTVVGDGTTTKFTMLDCTRLGFWTITVRFPAVAISA